MGGIFRPKSVTPPVCESVFFLFVGGEIAGGNFTTKGPLGAPWRGNLLPPLGGPGHQQMEVVFLKKGS